MPGLLLYEHGSIKGIPGFTIFCFRVFKVWANPTMENWAKGYSPFKKRISPVDL
jgi:hypothetical protein